MRLAVVVVGVLADDEDADVVVRRQLQGGEDLVLGREDLVTGALLVEEGAQLVEVGLLQLLADDLLPRAREL